MCIPLLVLLIPLIKVCVGVLMWAGVSGETLSSIMHDSVCGVNRMLHKKMSCRATLPQLIKEGHSRQDRVTECCTNIATITGYITLPKPPTSTLVTTVFRLCH